MPFPGVSNTFNPLTPVGEGLQNLTRLMFSGPTQADRDKAALNAAHADYYRAQTDATRAKLRADEQAHREQLLQEPAVEEAGELLQHVLDARTGGAERCLRRSSPTALRCRCRPGLGGCP